MVGGWHWQETAESRTPTRGPQGFPGRLARPHHHLHCLLAWLLLSYETSPQSDQIEFVFRLARCPGRGLGGTLGKLPHPSTQLGSCFQWHGVAWHEDSLGPPV